MKKPPGSTVAKQAASARPGFQPSAGAQSTAIEISSGRIGRMRKLFMAGDRSGSLTDSTAGDAVGVQLPLRTKRESVSVDSPLKDEPLVSTAAAYLDNLNPEQRRAVEHGASGPG